MSALWTTVYTLFMVQERAPTTVKLSLDKILL